MSKRIIATVAALLLLGATFILGSPDKTADLKKADRDWAEAAQSKNADQFASFLSDDANACGLDGKWVHGKAAIADEWKKMLADPGFKLSWTAESVEVSKDGDLGYTRGTFEGSQGSGSFSGAYTTVWKKGKDGKWLVAVDIASAAPPPQK
ncbi:MAG TPA: DUF4440 domain-containing protein [Candidatus Angelobacter sp.]|nr:DUF4440 domain-containing protein [Candidatus Angelobacter sp.]